MTPSPRPSVVSRPGVFGRRRPVLKKASTVAAPREPEAEEEVVAPAEDDPFILQSGRALYWSYLKACAASFAATMGFMTLFRSGLDLMPSFFDFNFLAAFAIAPAIAAMMMQPSIHVWRYVADRKSVV